MRTLIDRLKDESYSNADIEYIEKLVERATKTKEILDEHLAMGIALSELRFLGKDNNE